MPWPISELPYPFELEFMQRALVAGVMVGIFAPMIGIFLVQKRMSLIGDGIGHVAFAGVGAGLLLDVAPLAVALAFAVAGGVGIEWLRSHRRASGDVALALLFYSGIALGVTFASLGDGLNSGLLGYLFGQPLTVDGLDLVTVLGVGVAVIGTVLLLRRVLFAVVTDEEWSRVAGLPSRGVGNVLAALTAAAVVASMRIVGILLVAALMVLPVASAQQLASSFRGTMRWSVAIGVLSVVAGLVGSRLWGLAPGGAVVLFAAGVFAVVAIAKGGIAGRLSLAAKADL